MKVKKRDGKIVEFDVNKIEEAINKAFIEVKKEKSDIAKAIAFKVMFDLNYKNKSDSVSIEDIQDMVEEELFRYGCFDVAKAYITYRYRQQLARDNYSELMNAVKIKLNAENIRNQNANVDEASFGGRMGEVANEVMRHYALNYCMSDLSKNNHLNNEIYIHDLDHFAIGSHNCLTLPIDDLLKNGFKTRQVDIRPANSVNTAFQLVAVVFQLQSLQQFGGVSASHIDWTMVPYVRKSFIKHYKIGLKHLDWNEKKYKNHWLEEFNSYVDEDKSIEDAYFQEIKVVYDYALEQTKKEIHQAVEAMYHNLNSLQSRSGNQLPFTSINYGTCTLPEGRMITKEILEVSIEGVGALHRTSVFPK